MLNLGEYKFDITLIISRLVDTIHYVYKRILPEYISMHITNSELTWKIFLSYLEQENNKLIFINESNRIASKYLNLFYKLRDLIVNNDIITEDDIIIGFNAINIILSINTVYITNEEKKIILEQSIAYYDICKHINVRLKLNPVYLSTELADSLLERDKVEKDKIEKDKIEKYRKEKDKKQFVNLPKDFRAELTEISLNAIKNDINYRNYIKRRNIFIHTGIYKGEVATFGYWNGTCSVVFISGQHKRSISIRCIISLLI